ncbi:hypothetical protein Tco_1203155 [Tanacetum coccineum]
MYVAAGIKGKEGSKVVFIQCVIGIGLSLVKQRLVLKIISVHLKAEVHANKDVKVFLNNNVTTTENKDKSQRRSDIEDVPKLFLRDILTVLPSTFCRLSDSSSEYQIDLIPGAEPAARAPYRLAPSEMEELSDQLKSYPTKAL